MNSGINFGSLTIFVKGKAVDVSQYDENGDGKLQEDEYKKLIADNTLDTYNSKTIDKQEGQEMSPEELTDWGLQMLLEDTLKRLINTRVATEIIGKYVGYQQEIITELKEFTNNYRANNGLIDIYAASEEFEVLLPEKYEEIKNRIITGQNNVAK